MYALHACLILSTYQGDVFVIEAYMLYVCSSLLAYRVGQGLDLGACAS